MNRPTASADPHEGNEHEYDAARRCPGRPLARIGRSRARRPSADGRRGLEHLAAPDEELLDLLAAAYRVRHRWFGNRVDLNFLINAKSGLCGEDCGYCSQSRVSRAEIPRYNLLTAEQILDGARWPPSGSAKTYCMVISGRSPSDQELDTLSQVVPQVKATYGLKICFSVGLLSARTSRAAEGLRSRSRSITTSTRANASIRRFAPRTPTRTASTRFGPCERRGLKSAPAGSSAWARNRPTWWNWPCGSASCKPRPCRSISSCRSPARSWKGQPAQSALLSESARPVSAGQSALRVADCGGPRNASWAVAAARALPGQFDLRRRLSYRRRASRRKKIIA